MKDKITSTNVLKINLIKMQKPESKMETTFFIRENKNNVRREIETQLIE